MTTCRGTTVSTAPQTAATAGPAQEDAASFVYYADGAALLAGAGSFIADVRLPGMLECCFVRSPIARGRIQSIDVQVAAAAAGVARIATGAEIARAVPNTLPLASMVLHAAEARTRFNLPAYHLLPVDAVHYEGEAVAVIAAEDRYLAEDAAELLMVDYEEQAPVLDPEAALAPGCAQLFDDVAGNVALDAWFGSDKEPGAVFDDAAVVLRRRYRMHRSGNPRSGRTAW